MGDVTSGDRPKIQINCPQCNGPRTIYFDHVAKRTYALCPRCEGKRAHNA